MKKILFILMALMPIMTNAQNIKRGYHGFADLGYTKCLSQLDPSVIEITTSHGYQFNPYIFLGAGVGFDFTGSCKSGEVSGHAFQKRDSKVDIPFFFNAKANFTKTKLSPFADVKVGSYINNDCNIYANIALGCRYAMSNNMGISFSVGYKYRKATVELLGMTTGTKYNNYKSSFYYSDEKGYVLDGISFKVGFDF